MVVLFVFVGIVTVLHAHRVFHPAQGLHQLPAAGVFVVYNPVFLFVKALVQPKQALTRLKSWIDLLQLWLDLL